MKIEKGKFYFDIEIKEKIINESKEEKEIKGSPYDKYSVMSVDALYKVVKAFMIKNGVRKGPLEISLLNDKFGPDNIKKLTKHI